MFQYQRVVPRTLSEGCPTYLIRSLSSELIKGLFNGMIYKEKTFCFEIVFIHGIVCALRWGITLV